MNKYEIIPSDLRYKAAPAVDQELTINLDTTSKQIVEYDRNSAVNLSQIYDDERQRSTKFRPTFNVNYIYANTITGTTTYLPFKNNLYYVDPENSKTTGIWKGFPQYYEFDFFRPNVNDGHINYRAKSAYTYNWMFYLTYAKENNPNKNLYYTSPDFGTINWLAMDGIPFKLSNNVQNGNQIIGFNCIAQHGLSVGEYVELSFNYNNTILFQVYSLGNGEVDSENYIFNIFNIGYTGTTFLDGKTGTFKRVINPNNLEETKSLYYIRVHEIISATNDINVTKNGFAKNLFNDEKKFEYSSITPNNISRISQKVSNNSYNITLKNDVDLQNLSDNQKRPISEIFLTVINKGYSGYFNFPKNSIGLKQGWSFNITDTSNPWWDYENTYSNSDVLVDYYDINTDANRRFYYNKELNVGNKIDGDFCEWNNFEQVERVISTHYHKIKFNENIFQTNSDANNNPIFTNLPGYYYQPHHKLTIRVFSDYIETANTNSIYEMPTYSYYSTSNSEFMWRDIYTYGFIDELNRGVDYPYLNNVHYPYVSVNFKLIPEGANYKEGQINIITKPIIDECE